MDWGSGITYLGETSVKGKPVKFGIKDQDRLEHLSILGKSPGRAALFAQMAIQDIERGVGTILIDLSGDAAESVIERISEPARKRLIYLDPSDAEYPFSWNPLQDYRVLDESVAVSELSALLFSLYRLPFPEEAARSGKALAFVSPLIERIAASMLADKSATLLTLYELVAEPLMRDRAMPAGSPLRAEFEALLEKEPEIKEAIITNGRYLAKDTLMRNLLGQSSSKFSVTSMAAGTSILLDLSRIRMFPTRVTPLVRLFAHAARISSELSGTVPAFYSYESLRAFSDADLARMFLERKVAGVFADSAYNDEEHHVRKYALIRSGTLIAGAPKDGDMPMIEEFFFPYVTPEDTEKLEAGEIVLMLTIDGVRSRPFFAKALPLPARAGASAHDVQVASREYHSVPRHTVDQAFQRKYAPPEAARRDADPAAFSSAFRSIFAKNANGAAASGAPQPVPQSSVVQAGKTAPQSPVRPAADVNKKPPEISEEELKGMLHVEQEPPS